MLLNTPQNVWATCCARIPNVTWVQLCSRLQQAAKRRVDQHPAVTAVLEKPRAPIQWSCMFASFAKWFISIPQAILTSHACRTQQSCSCFSAVQFCSCLTGSHAASWGRGHFAIHVRDSSCCTYTYRSRWGRATCLSNWAQGLNMERLRAQAPWRSHTQTP